MTGRLPRATKTLKFSPKTRTRLEGVAGLVELVARKNPVVDTVLTAKEVHDNVKRIVEPEDA